MDMEIRNDIIIFTVLQELKRASIHHESSNVRLFSQELINKINYEIDNWEKSVAT